MVDVLGVPVEGDVLGQGAVEEKDLLRDVTDAGLPGGKVLADVGAVNDDRPGLRLEVMVGMACYGAATGASTLCGQAALERVHGWSRQLALTPLSTAAYVATKAVVASLTAAVAVAVTFAVAAAGGVAPGPAGWVLGWLVGWLLGHIPGCVLTAQRGRGTQVC